MLDKTPKAHRSGRHNQQTTYIRVLGKGVLGPSRARRHGLAPNGPLAAAAAAALGYTAGLFLSLGLATAPR